MTVEPVQLTKGGYRIRLEGALKIKSILYEQLAKKGAPEKGRPRKSRSPKNLFDFFISTYLVYLYFIRFYINAPTCRIWIVS